MTTGVPIWALRVRWITRGAANARLRDVPGASAASQRSILAAIADACGDDGYVNDGCEVTVATLAAECLYHEDTVRRALKALRDAELITAEPRRGRSTLFALVVKHIEPGEEQPHSGGCRDSLEARGPGAPFAISGPAHHAESQDAPPAPYGVVHPLTPPHHAEGQDLPTPGVAPYTRARASDPDPDLDLDRDLDLKPPSTFPDGAPPSAPLHRVVGVQRALFVDPAEEKQATRPQRKARAPKPPKPPAPSAPVREAYILAYTAATGTKPPMGAADHNAAKRLVDQMGAEPAVQLVREVFADDRVRQRFPSIRGIASDPVLPLKLAAGVVIGLADGHRAGARPRSGWRWPSSVRPTGVAGRWPSRGERPAPAGRWPTGAA